MIVPSWISSIASDDDAIAQIVVDDSRQHLYTRSSKGVLIVYDLGKRLSRPLAESYSLLTCSVNVACFVGSPCRSRLESRISNDSTEDREVCQCLVILIALFSLYAECNIT